MERLTSKIWFFVATGMLAATAACEPMNSGFEPTLNPADTSCTSGQAQIEVGDGYQRILCGCAEASGNVISSDGAPDPALTCTVPAGTVVFFEFLTTQVKHQIISTGSPSFPSGALSDPSTKPPFRIDGITFSPAGIYHYEDAFGAGTTGQIIAQ